MAKTPILRIAIWLLSTPFFLASKLCQLCNLLDLRSDLNHCRESLARFAHHPISDELFIVLQLAEDHRNHLHFGIDPIAIARAIWKTCSGQNLQGGSTIEQQFVRAATGRYERTLLRKLREQLLAISLHQVATKREIASACLAVVYYGDRYGGPLDILVPLGRLTTNAGFHESAHLIARVKYPEPHDITTDWLRRFNLRVSYLLRLSHKNREGDLAVVRSIQLQD